MDFSRYLSALDTNIRRGDASEHTHRPTLKILIESLHRRISAVNEPRRSEIGAPDFKIIRGETPIGFIETKALGTNLVRESRSEQLTRYRAGISNLILTDYLDFRWYVNGEFRASARLATYTHQRGLRLLRSGQQDVENILNNFAVERTFIIRSSEDLARNLARSGRLIRSLILSVLADEDAHGRLHKQLQGFKRVLIADLDDERFADMYAQTICYGLFAARIEHASDEAFTRRNAAWCLPASNPFLRQMFNYIAGPALSARVAWAVDDLADLLSRADVRRVMRNFGTRGGRQDPVFHFYETFLSAYDPKERELRGVYFTPTPVVDYMVRGVNYILRQYFGIEDELADCRIIRNADGQAHHRVVVLDPAVGTGTFLHAFIADVKRRFVGNEGEWPAYVREHLIPRMYGFELLMAPYTIAHIKLGLQLSRFGFDLGEDERLNIFLTNTLEANFEHRGLPLFASWIAEEAEAAAAIKNDAPVMIVIGNPPYSGTSSNHGTWIVDLLRGFDHVGETATHSYFEVDGHSLGERQSRWLHDDYVKFIRFAQWRIERTGAGILAFITNHRYLVNATFRGMRQALLESFDQIYILDLHGNSKSGEASPEEVRDENVFDIQQGVALIFAVKSSTQSGETHVWRSDLWGLRSNRSHEGVEAVGKYEWLQDTPFESSGWRNMYPVSPDYLFEPGSSFVTPSVVRQPSAAPAYETLTAITDIFPVRGSGFISGFREVGTAVTEDELIERIEQMRLPAEVLPDAELGEVLQFTDHHELGRLRSRLRAMPTWRRHIQSYLHRPFDIRAVFFDKSLLVRPVERLQRNLLQSDNTAIVVSRHFGFYKRLCDRSVNFIQCARFRRFLRSGLRISIVYCSYKQSASICL